MENEFISLEENDDVLLLNQDTFTVRRFKELVEREINTKLNTTVNAQNLPIFDINFCTITLGDEVKIVLNDIQWCNSPRDCQLLKVGSQGWQKGKLRIQVDTKILRSNDRNKIHICIEFCPDEPTAPESPLDDLRQLPEYKQQL